MHNQCLTEFLSPRLKEGHQVFPTDVIDTGVTAEGVYFLEFKYVNHEDVGRYVVHASNPEGSAEAETTLTVVREYPGLLYCDITEE